MSLKRFVLGTVSGAVVVFGAGLVLFSLPFARDFYVYAMEGGAATGVAREAPLLWAAFLGAVAYAALVSLAIGAQARTPGVPGGVAIGAVVGFLTWSTANLMFFAISNVGTMTSALVDPLLELVPGAIAGGVIAALFRRMEAAPRLHP